MSSMHQARGAGFLTPNGQVPRRITKTQFLKKYGKDLANNDYMQ